MPKKVRKIEADDLWRGYAKYRPEKGDPAYGSEGIHIDYVDRGELRGWCTMEIYTPDLEEILGYIDDLDPNSRVWISAFGTQYICSPPGSTHCFQQKGHATILSNTAARDISNPALPFAERAEQKLAIFTGPGDDVQIDYYCVRHK